MFYHSELQLIHTEHSMEASMQFISRFLDLHCGVWQAAFSTVVIGSVRVGIGVWRFATVCHLHHFIPDTSQPSSCGSARVRGRAASQQAVTQDLTLSISHIITSDCRSDAIIIEVKFS